ncbi:MAG: hypothetical protein I8H91_14475 [Burkholderiales bacterium]|nr:hypothetical protein [Burkholderiales bacterium]
MLSHQVGGIIGAGGELSWPRPARPGDVLRGLQAGGAAQAAMKPLHRRLIRLACGSRAARSW